MLDWKTKIIALIISISLLVIVIELVRSKRLREEYSLLWIVVAGIIFLLTIWFDLLMFIAKLIGAKAASSALFFLGLIFLVIINLHYSVQLTKFRNHIKIITQRLALLEEEIKKSHEERSRQNQKNS